MRFNKVLLVVLILFYACGNERPNLGDIKEIPTESAKQIGIKAKVRASTEKYSMEELLDTLFIIPLSNEQYIAEITELEIVDEQIYIFDDLAQAVFMFDFNGAFLGAIDQKGKGPGEYIKIADMEIDEANEEILLLDQFNRKILHYDLKGHFKNEKKFTTHARHFYAFGNSQYAIYNDFNNRWGEVNYNLFLTDSNGKVIQAMLPFDEAYRRTDRIKRSYFTGYNSSVANYIGHYDNHWYRISQDSIWAEYFLDFGNENIPEGVVHDSFEVLDEYAHNISNFYENANFLTFSYTYQKTRYIRYFNKSSDTLLEEKLHLPNIVYFNFNFPVKATYDGYFVNAVDSEYYPQLEQFKDLELKDVRLKSISEKLKSITEDDNAVLFFYKIKDL